MKKYNQSFWLFFAVIMGITAIIVLINIYSPVSVKELTEDAGVHIETVDESLKEIQEKFDQYGRIINQFAEIKNDENLLAEEIETMEKRFLVGDDFTIGVCYEITSDSSGDDKTLKKHITRNGAREIPLEQIVHFPRGMNWLDEKYIHGGWKRVSYKDTEVECLLYTRPVFRQGQPIGYIGMLLSVTLIRKQIERDSENLDWEFFLFTNETEFERTIDKKNRNQTDMEPIYIHKVLSTGMVYTEIHKDVKQIRYNNMMILLVSFFAVAAMLMIQRKNQNRKTVFEQISDFIMKNYITKLTSAQRQGYRATIALNIGMTTAIFADVIYSVTLGREIKTLSEYFGFFSISCGVLFIYKFSKTGITKKLVIGIITIGLIASLAEHIISGGFAMGKAGESFLWFIIYLYMALFILAPSKAVHVLSTVIILLFFNVVMEIILFQKTNYTDSYLFSIGFILLSFALYNAMEVYVSGAAGHYRQTKRLIKELNTNHDLLLHKEKLGALGHLISGVAHEINTPIGAIKASAETMDSIFMTTLKEILNTAGAYSDEEYKAFLELVSMTLEAKSEMKSTLEVRIGKQKVKKYFEEINLEKRERILTLIGELEIVNPEQIREKLKLFQMEDITGILERVTKLSAFTSGIPIVLYASDRIAQIVLALKSYVHTNATGENVEFDLIKSIENVLILFRNQLKGNITINRIYENSSCIITGNPDGLAQVWTNLIQNAIYAMNDGGELTIKIREMDEGNVEVSVGDTGTGIAPELLSQIYDPFFTTRQGGEGSGLGLNITKKIIEKHNGVLEVESQVGKGTTFHIRLCKISYSPHLVIASEAK